MDYGGHNSSFHDNIIVTKENDAYSNCVGTGPFLPNATDAFNNNTCFVRNNINNKDSLYHYLGTPVVVGNVDSCDIEYFNLHDNVYATTTGNASFLCGEEMISVDALARNISTIGDYDKAIMLPDDEILLKIVKDKVNEIFAAGEDK